MPSHVTKNGRMHRVPLSRQAKAILDELREQAAGSEWVLASPSPRAKGQRLGKLNKAAQRLRTAAGLEGSTGHDLRRTAATGMAALGVKPHVIGRVLNHSDHSVTARVYDQHAYDAEKKAALVRWGERVEAVVTGRVAAGSKVVRIA